MEFSLAGVASSSVLCSYAASVLVGTADDKCGSLESVVEFVRCISPLCPSGQGELCVIPEQLKNAKNLGRLLGDALFLGVILGFGFSVFTLGLLPRFIQALVRTPQMLRRAFWNSKHVRGQIDTALQDLRDKLSGGFNKVTGMSFQELPEQGVPEREVLHQLTVWSSQEERHWVGGKLSGCVYHGRDLPDRMAVESYKMFSLANQMHPSVFPSVRKMESELISMVSKLFNCPSACGATTSGGTESILMAIRAYRGASRLRGITKPNLVIPSTAHAAFDKACDYLDIELRKVHVDGVSMRADVGKMRRRIDSNTIALVGSAVAFPHGTMDPIPELAQLARRYSIGLHVDCCLGSFVVPFAEAAGFSLAPFDFRVVGVTSISCDPHKYGLSPKGVSVVMFSSNKLRRNMFCCVPDWSGGMYGTATQAGSRPGALVVGAWSTLVAMGRVKYVNAARRVLTAAKSVQNIIRETDGVMIVGEPALTVVAFTTAPGVAGNILNVLDAMTDKGWELNALQFPTALHVCVTLPMVERIDAFASDLRDSLTEVGVRQREGTLEDGPGAAMYGMAARVPLEVKNESVEVYLECTLTPKKKEHATF